MEMDVAHHLQPFLWKNLGTHVVIISWVVNYYHYYDYDYSASPSACRRGGRGGRGWTPFWGQCLLRAGNQRLRIIVDFRWHHPTDRGIFQWMFTV